MYGISRKGEGATHWGSMKTLILFYLQMKWVIMANYLYLRAAHDIEEEMYKENKTDVCG